MGGVRTGQGQGRGWGSHQKQFCSCKLGQRAPPPRGPLPASAGPPPASRARRRGASWLQVYVWGGPLVSGGPGWRGGCVTSAGMSPSARWSTGSVVLEEREQVVIAVCGEVGWAQVGQQLVRVSQFWEQLRTKQTRQLWAWVPSRDAAHPSPRHRLALEPLSLLCTGALPAKDCSVTRNHL